ncbi:MAG: hypothetical protein JWN41_1520 [Thermoleophilia bacterium]|nr:hypothetical protein [Thermoleophilia bacterium]
MLLRTLRRFTLLSLCIAAVMLAAAVAAGAADSTATSADAAATQPSPAPRATVRVKVNITKFVVDGTRIVALGTASSSVGSKAQTRAVRLSVSKTVRCSVLALNLKELRLQLLGLHVDVGTVNLTIKGDARRSLGALFCKLSHAIALNNLTSKQAAAKSLTRSLDGRPMPMLAFSTRVGKAGEISGNGTCKVLDLTLGPLHLDLVGLIVDLYGATATSPVVVHVSADPNGGVLGSTFCKLATA